MANKPTGLQKANQKKKNIKFAKRFPQKLAAGKRMGKIKAAHQAMANPEATQAVNQAVESRLARAKNVHQAITGGVPSKPGFAPSERKQHGESIGPSEKLQGMGRKRAEAKDYSKYQSVQPKTEAPAFGPKKQSSELPKQMGHTPESLTHKKENDFRYHSQYIERQKPSIRNQFGIGPKDYSENEKQEQIKKSARKVNEAKSYAKEQSALPKTEAPAFGPRKQSASSSGPYNKSKEEISKANDAIKVKKAQDYAKQQSSKPKTEAPAFGPRNTGLNVESKHKSPVAKITKNPNQFDAYTKARASDGKDAWSSLRSPAKIADHLYDHSKPTPKASSSKKPDLSSLGPYQKNIKDTTKADAWKHEKDMRSRQSFKSEEVGKIKNAPFKDPNYRPKTQAETESMWSKIKAQGAKKPVEKKASQPKPAAIQPSKPKAATAPPAFKPTQASDRKPSVAGGIAKAAATHIGMALMHGTNYPRVMAQHAAQGPREFKPGWHGFTSPVERPKAEEATDTKGERG